MSGHDLDAKDLEFDHSSPSHSDYGEADWTPKEERKVVRKLDMIIMPLLITTFIGLQLDRSNIANALTDNFLGDVGITQDQFNVGQQLLYVGIVVLEIPSNMILYRIGPRLWIGGQVLAWSLVSIFQSFQEGYPAFLTTRLLLGLCEAGFIPASLWTITMWYKNDETSARFSWFFMGNFFATALGGDIAYGVLHMRGIAGLAGWQWLFILEGLYTIVVGALLFCLMPESRDRPIPYVPFQFFSEREQHIISRRIPLDDPLKTKKGRSISAKELLNALGNWKMWPHLFLGLATMGPVNTLNTYAPTLVTSYGFDALASNAYVSIGMWIQLCFTPLVGYIADRTRRRGIVVLVIQSLFWVLLLGDLLVAESNSRDTRMGLLIATLCVTQEWHPVNSAWLAINAGSPAERSIRMACMIMAVNLAGVYGAQIFREDDAPNYHRGWRVIQVILSFGVAVGIFCNVMYRLLNRRARVKEQSEGVKARKYWL